MRKPGKQMMAEVREEMILSVAKSMFAVKGFDGVSMRDLANAVGITPPTLYHYFPTKLSLQIATLEYAQYGQGSTQNTALSRLQAPAATGEERLRNFILRLCERFHEDPEFFLLLERALVSDNKEIIEAFYSRIFHSVMSQSEAMFSEIAPNFNTHLFTTFIYSLVVHTYKLLPLRKRLASYREEFEDPVYVTDQIMKLLSTNVLQRDT